MERLLPYLQTDFDRTQAPREGVAVRTQEGEEHRTRTAEEAAEQSLQEHKAGPQWVAAEPRKEAVAQTFHRKGHQLEEAPRSHQE